MGSISLSLSILYGLGFFLVIYGLYRNHKRAQTNLYVSEELDIMIKNVLNQIERNKKFEASRAQSIKGNAALGEDMNLSSPEMLSTIVTVIINKLGTMRLNMKDFAAVPEGEYVSVYVDTLANDLVFSLDNTLESKEPLTMMSFVDPDDETFH